jgi:hypothetical protein
MSWEKEIKRNKVLEGINSKVFNRELAENVRDKILSALAIPDKIPQAATVITYRNRISHRYRPAVDYAKFYVSPSNRLGEPIMNAQGFQTGRSIAIYATAPLAYTFTQLDSAFREHLSALVEMMQMLSEIDEIHP